MPVDVRPWIEYPVEVTVIVRGPLAAIATGADAGRGDSGCERLRGRRDRCRPLLGRPRLGLDRGDARGVQALLLPEARDEAAARGGGRGEPGRSLLGRGCDGVQLRRLCRRAERRAAASCVRASRACSMIRLFWPAARLRLSSPASASSSDSALSRTASGSPWSGRS